MTKKLNLSLLLTATFVLSSSLVRADEYSNIPSGAPAPAEQSITLTRDNANTTVGPSPQYYKTTVYHLKKGEEKTLLVNNPDGVWHNATIDPNYEAKQDSNCADAVGCTIDGGSMYDFCFHQPAACLKAESNLNTDGDPMTYHFKATDIAGTAYVYFNWSMKTGYDWWSPLYFDQRIEIIVDKD